MRSSLPILTLVGFSQCLGDQQPLGTTSSGIEQPLTGFGTWNLKESADNTSSAVSIAIESGFRQIDCAAAYGNEKAVGKGIADGLQRTGLKREGIWVTSKLWNDHHDPDRVEAGLNQTLSDLNLNYLDLYLMHWPVGKGPHDSKYHYDYLSTWHAMSKLLSTGRVRHIGISNFSPAQLKDIIAKSDVKPAVHQMELHPYLNQQKWVEWHKQRGIGMTAYSPLGNMNPTYGDRRVPATRSKAPLLLENAVVKKIGEKRGCTAAQVVLAWGMSRGTSVIPKSKHAEYIKENFNTVNCRLGKSDVKKIDQLGKEPTKFNNPSEGWGVHLFEGLDDA